MNSVEYWQEKTEHYRLLLVNATNRADSIERQRIAVFRALADLTNKHDDLLTSRNAWRLVAIVMAAGYLVILLNTYTFGGAA